MSFTLAAATILIACSEAREMQSKISQNMLLLSADELLKNWMAIGQGAQEQFRKLMEASLPCAKSSE